MSLYNSKLFCYLKPTHEIVVMEATYKERGGEFSKKFYCVFINNCLNLWK